MSESKFSSCVSSFRHFKRVLSHVLLVYTWMFAVLGQKLLRHTE